ncbi:hypothetical protein [Sphingomonas sp.]|uniref:hypothetical protein n=1 Tax=Sphingomonas sp. TaxID=28214 RepID=UPI001AFF84F9|nr:hypothetical protein [Sphingomonas sp.]MBO9715046.1 hypothetical protein [Sphingomonas sp.]
MRNRALFAVAALVIATPALADDWDFMLINSTGKEIKTIEVSPTGANAWQPNKVDPELKKENDGVIKATGRTTIHFDKKSSDCRYDVKATFTDASNAVWTNINVCDNAYVTIKYANGAPTFSAN